MAKNQTHVQASTPSARITVTINTPAKALGIYEGDIAIIDPATTPTKGQPIAFCIKDRGLQVVRPLISIGKRFLVVQGVDTPMRFCLNRIEIHGRVVDVDAFSGITEI